MKDFVSNQLATKIKELLISARTKVLQTVNHTMVLTYFEIGRMIVEEEQNGKNRADYGKQIIKTLSERLTNEFGKGFSQRNLEQIRQFYSVFAKTQTLSAEFKKSQKVSDEFNLSWSHYLKLMMKMKGNFMKLKHLKTNGVYENSTDNTIQHYLLGWL